MGRRWLWVVLFGVGCTRAADLKLPTPPEGARSAIFFVATGSGAPLAFGSNLEAGEWPPEPINLQENTILGLNFYSTPLEWMLLRPGPLTSGDGRLLPVPLGIHEWRDGAWRELARVDDQQTSFVGFRLGVIDDARCGLAGGCYGISDYPDFCQIPCPCPSEDSALNGRWAFPPECPIPSSPRTALCYDRPRPFTALNALGQGLPNATQANPGQVLLEGDRLVLYFETDRYFVPVTGNDNNFTRIAKVVLTGIDTVDETTVEDVPLIPAPTSAGPLGWLSPPRIRRDGLELFLDGNFPDADWHDEEIFVASRSSVNEPFGPIKVVESLGRSDSPPSLPDEVKRPVLLPDDRTLLYDTGAVQFGARTATVAGDDRILPDRAVSLGLDTQGYALSCDRRHLLYVDLDRTGPEALAFLQVARLARLSPVGLDPPQSLLDSVSRRRISFPISGDMFLAERPDCQAIYLGYGGLTFILEARPCP